MKFNSNLDGLIECLQTMRKYASGDTPVCINLWGDRHYALQSIYYDTDMGGEESIYLEGDYEDKAESSSQFTVEDTTDMIKEIETKKVISTSFIDDIDKMYDFMDLGIDRKTFLTSYSYLTEEEYDITYKDITPLMSEDELSKHNRAVVINLVKLMQQAENMHIEDMNGRPNKWNVKGSEFKHRIAQWVSRYLTHEQTRLFIELCNSMEE